MSDFGNAVLTSAGLSLLARAIEGDIRLEFTRMALGDGVYSEEQRTPAVLQTMQSLKSEKQSYYIGTKEIQSDNAVKLTAYLTNWDKSTGKALFTEGFYQNEIGLYARAVGDESSEVLYAIAVSESGQGTIMPAFNGTNPTQAKQAFICTVNSSSDITVVIDPNTILADSQLLSDSENPVQNKTITAEFDAIKAYRIPSEVGAFGLRYWNGQFQVNDGTGWSKAKTVDVTLMSISVDKQPTTTSYNSGDALTTDGIAVTAHFSDGSTKDVTDSVTFTPAAGTKLTEDNKSVAINYTWHSEDLNTDMSAATSFNISVKRVLSSIAITTKPTKSSYNKGEAVSYTGTVVTATFTSGNTENVTNKCTFSPKEGTALNTLGANTITATYTEGSVTKTATTTVNVSVKTVAWATGTDQEIADMVAAADAGTIKLSDYWTVGQERKVHLSAMAATGVGESHVAQDVTLVLMNAGGKTDTNGKEVNFIVGQKNGLANGTNGEYGYMNSSNTNSGGWDGCARRKWCNSVYYNAIPSTLRSIFKKFRNVTASAGNVSTKKTSEDYFTLPSEVEVFGTTTYANATAENENKQFTYYATSSNRIKKCGDGGSANWWWERSPRGSYAYGFCGVDGGGAAGYDGASDAILIAPFGCI